MLTSILIANRGEIAVRVIRACQEMDIRAVAVYSDADAHALHVRLADEAVHVGPATPGESYLVGEKLIAAAHDTGCEAIHPGYGFLSEAPAFAEAVREAGLTFIGPSAEAIRAMGVKTEARALMEAAGVPVVPGYQPEADATDDDFIAAAESIGYPVMVKAAGGGGGKGIRVVHEPGRLTEAIQAARHEANKAFGDPRVFLEKYIEAGRHIEIQVLADTHGNTVHLFERECSVQRRHQKIIEESPSVLLDAATRQAMGQAAVDAAEAVGYVNAGTVEFIVDAHTRDFYFLEMNTRLQVEHPVTEMVTGIDLVQQQIRVAAGERLPFTQADLGQHGHAIECRLYAEDPASGFLPATGPVLRFITPEGPGIRVDSGITTGDAITVHYDPLLAKIIVHAATREAAIERMGHTLAQTALLGSTTNRDFLRAVLAHETFRASEATTTFVDKTFANWQPPDRDLPTEALIAAAVGDWLGKQQAQISGEAQGDAYSPWARADSFRMGGG